MTDFCGVHGLVFENLYVVITLMQAVICEAGRGTPPETLGHVRIYFHL